MVVAVVTLISDWQLLLSVGSLVAGATWWASAVFLQVRSMSMTLRRTEKLLTIEFGGITDEGCATTGRLHNKFEKINDRVDSLERQLQKNGDDDEEA